MTEIPVKNHIRDFVGIVFIALCAALLLKTFVIDAVYVPSPSMESTICAGDYIFVNKLIYGSSSPKFFPFTQAVIPFFHLPPLKKIKRGDVIVFEFPKVGDNASDHPVYFIKRCLGLAGDTLNIDHGKVYINGEQKDLLIHSDASSIQNYGPVVVPQRGKTINLIQDNFSEWEQLIREEGHQIGSCSSSQFIIDGKPATSYTIEKNYLFVIGDNMNHSYDSRAWGFLPEENVIGNAMMIYWSTTPSTSIRSVTDFLASIRWSHIGRFIN